MNAAPKIALAIGGLTIAGVGGYLLYRYLQNGLVPEDSLTMDYNTPSPLTIGAAMAGTTFPELWVRWDNQEIIYADPAGAPPPFQWPRVVEANGGRPLIVRRGPTPREARAVPVKRGADRTPIVNFAVDHRNPDHVFEVLKAYTGHVKSSALIGCDPRILMLLGIRENGYGAPTCRGFCLFNNKSQGRVYADSWAVLRDTMTVKTTIPNASAIFVVVDGVSSVDGYPEFGSFPQCFDFLETTLRAPKYRDALALLRAGGRDSAIEFGRRLGGNFSGSTAEKYVADFTTTWDNCERRLGARWAR